MKDEMKTLLKLILAQEQEEERERNAAKGRRKQPEDGSPQQIRNVPDVSREIREDMAAADRDMYPDHEAVFIKRKEGPIWEKYALTVAEASEYFHLGESKIREIIKRDRYAPFLVWNGKRVFIKRKMFEKYLDDQIRL